MFLYSLLLLLVLVVGAPYWLYRMATSGRYRAGLGQRLGSVPQHLRTMAAGRSVVWVHAVSVGETLAAARLIAELETAMPELLIALSTTTDTGQQLAAKKIGAERVFYFPLDLAFAVRSWLDALQPKMLVLMESELWPRMLHECARRNIPVAVVNGRISDRSLPRYRRLRAVWRRVLENVGLLLAQDEEHARRWMEIGAPPQRVHAIGNLKYDVSSATETAITQQIRARLGQTHLLVAGSTLPGEENAVLAAWPTILQSVPGLVLAIAPRHPQRFDEVWEQVCNSGAAHLRCNQITDESGPIQPGTILLLDTIGDLASLYALAAAALVGGSLVPMGGHNPLEPAQFGVPVVMGPSFENFRDIVKKMRSANGILILENSESLAQGCVDLLEHGTAMGERGREVFLAQAGATRRAVEQLLPFLRDKL